jgi:hypothetical protein
VKVFLTKEGVIVGYGDAIAEEQDFLKFEVDDKDVGRYVPIIENGVVVGVEVDETIVIDPETNETVPIGETLQERLERTEKQQALMQAALDELLLGGA